MKERVEFVRFAAKNASGLIFTVIGYQYFVSHNPLYGLPVRLKAEVEYWTDAGTLLIQIDTDTYRFQASKEIITRLY